ncbi:MAG TPA: N-acetyltransferase [Burkholderiales bacterium]|nr:N-acetyltransferase [Burkholderiales bacterium]
MPAALKIRRATARDAAVLVEFNRAMALETERKDLWPRVIGAGVRALLRRPDSGFYSVAELDGEVIGALMVTKEWSDWRNGDFWWIQSVYVRPEFRRRGVYRRMYAYLHTLAARDGAVVGFRLYVERNNRRAQSTYRASGMERTRYLVYEHLKPHVRFFTPVADASSRRRPKARTRR